MASSEDLLLLDSVPTPYAHLSWTLDWLDGDLVHLYRGLVCVSTSQLLREPARGARLPSLRRPSCRALGTSRRAQGDVRDQSAACQLAHEVARVLAGAVDSPLTRHDIQPLDESPRAHACRIQPRRSRFESPRPARVGSGDEVQRTETPVDWELSALSSPAAGAVPATGGGSGSSYRAALSLSLALSRAPLLLGGPLSNSTATRPADLPSVTQSAPFHAFLRPASLRPPTSDHPPDATSNARPLARDRLRLRRHDAPFPSQCPHLPGNRRALPRRRPHAILLLGHSQDRDSLHSAQLPLFLRRRCSFHPVLLVCRRRQPPTGRVRDRDRRRCQVQVPPTGSHRGPRRLRRGRLAPWKRGIVSEFCLTPDAFAQAHSCTPAASVHSSSTSLKPKCLPLPSRPPSWCVPVSLACQTLGLAA